MNLPRKETLFVVLQVGTRGAYVRWRTALGNHGQEILSDYVNVSPLIIIEWAIKMLNTHLKKDRVELLAESAWRLVLSGGYSCLAPRPEGRWRSAYALALAGELEAVCPLPLEQLAAVALPVGSAKAWIAALPLPLLDSWTQAARDANIVLAGIWSSAMVLVETVLDSTPQSLDSLTWSDGQHLVEIRFLSRPPLASDTVKLPHTIHPDIEQIRLRPEKSISRNASWEAILQEGEPPGVSATPVEFMPALLADRLARIDPSESFNCLRGKFQSHWSRRVRQRPLTRSLILCSVAFLLLTLVGKLDSRVQQRSAQASADQMAALWHEIQPQSPLPAIPFSRLEGEVVLWSNFGNKMRLRPPPVSNLQKLAVLVQALPPNIAVSLQSIHTQGPDFWIDGLVKTPTEAHKLEESLAKIPHIHMDPIRISSGIGATARFTLHLIFVE